MPNSAPVITSGNTFVVSENSTYIGNIVATDADNDTLTYYIGSGADRSQFAINSSGQLMFRYFRDYETAQDANHDNIYEVQVAVKDSYGHMTYQSVTVQVTDVAESGLVIAAGNNGGLTLGTTGDDLIRGGTGNDGIQAGDGDDQVGGGAGNDNIEGGRGNDIVEGEAGNDHVWGNVGNDIVTGGAGNDWLDGGAGQDTYIGGSGADVFYFAARADSAPSAADTINDFDASQGDKIDFTALGSSASQMTVTGSSGNYTVSLDFNNDSTADFVVNVVSAAPLTSSDFMF